MRPRFISRSPTGWLSRLFWFVGLWAGSVLALAIVATALKGLMHLAGLLG